MVQTGEGSDGQRAPASRRLDEVRGNRLVGQVCLTAVHAYRGSSESRRVGTPPAQAGLVTEVAVLILEGTSVREGASGLSGELPRP
jgi:hypothetical protein